MSRRVAPRIALVAVVAAAFGGCSTGVDAGDRTNARSAGTVFLELCGEGRGSDLAKVLNGPALAAAMEAGDVPDACAKILRVARGLPASAFGEGRITRVQTNGGNAEMDVALPRPGGAGPVHGTLEAERSGDRWEITNTSFGA